MTIVTLPENLSFIVNLCYQSQRHQIESSVKGWERASKDTLSTTPPTPLGTNPPTPKQEEEEKGEEEEEEQVQEEVKIITLLSSLDFQSKEIQQNEFNRISFSFWKLFKEVSKTKKTKNLDKATLEDWAKTVRLMIENDERTLEEIQSIYKFLKVDEFWQTNCQTIHKVRSSFEQLYLNSKKTNQSNGKQPRNISQERIDALKKW